MNNRDKGTTDMPDAGRARLNQRLRRAFIEGAEELERVLWRYPGDLPEHREQ